MSLDDWACAVECNWNRALTIDQRSQRWFLPVRPHSWGNKKEWFPSGISKALFSEYNLSLFTPSLSRLFFAFPLLCPAFLTGGRRWLWQSWDIGCPTSTMLSWQRQSWFIWWITSPQASPKASVLCPLSCSVTAFPPALRQWESGVGLFVSFIKC